MNTSAKIEAILFSKGEPVQITKLAQLIGLSLDDMKSAISALKSELSNRGITLVINDDEVCLGTNPLMAETIAKLTREELDRDLGKAGLETLSIVLYEGPISRAEIDYIRGVNSQFILRNLLIRGLIERIDNPTDARSFLYKPTLDLLAHLGVSEIKDLPEYEKVRGDIQSFRENKDVVA